MDALLALLIATVASFIGSLQAGLVNTAVLADTLRYGRTTARRTALGGAVPEILYAGLAFLAADRILAWTGQWGVTPHRITAVVLIVLGLYIAFIMRPYHIKEQTAVRSGFRKGFLLALMNPQLVLFWCGVRLGMEVLGLQLHGWGALAGFSLGAFLGAMALLLLLVRLGGHMREHMAGRTLIRLFRGVGVVLVLVRGMGLGNGLGGPGLQWVGTIGLCSCTDKANDLFARKKKCYLYNGKITLAMRNTLTCAKYLITLTCALSGILTVAQQVNVGIYPTAVPDSFEVRVYSDGPVFDGVVGAAVFTVRWESTAGGVITASDIAPVCVGSLVPYPGGTQDVMGYRYATFGAFDSRPLTGSCAITTEGVSMFGFKIRDISGCYNVELAHNPYTELNNIDYYFVVFPGNTTGEIITGPISVGDCPPCEPPLITEIGADSVPYCGMGVNLWSEVSGTLPDHAWYRPDGSLLSWQPQVQSQFEPAGTYTLVVNNACGADTAQVDAVVDPALCVPVVADSAWFTRWGYSADTYMGVHLHVASSGSCPQYTWVVPWGDTLAADVHYLVNVPNPVPGNYTLFVSNDCGSDTLVLYVDPPEPCSVPVITASISTQDSCGTGRAYFTASASGPGPITTRWYGADGQLVTGSPNFTMPHAPWGLYTFTASNHCGSDTVTVFHGAADTTGLADCQPPQILSLSAVPAACFQDTVDLVSSVFLTGPCPSLVWGNVEVLDVSGEITQVVLDHEGPVTLTATNACGQVKAEVPMEVIFPAINHRSLCRVTGPLSIDSLLALYTPPPTGGQWWLEGNPHNGIYDPMVDTTGTYRYCMDTSGVYCMVVEFNLHEYPGVYAGEDTSVTVCSTDAPFALFDLLGGQAEPGGHWMLGPPFPALPYVDGMFDPASSEAGTYRYGVSAPFVSGGGCSDHADVQVALEQATTWYADHDGDGLGDPADTLLACDPPAGYVDAAGDECPGIHGTVGDPCDDDDPNTVNDVITEDCVCEGELGTGVDEREALAMRLWPNPNDGHSFFLQISCATDDLRVALIDATGRLLLQETRPGPAHVTMAFELPKVLAGGTYFVRVGSAQGITVNPLTVVR